MQSQIKHFQGHGPTEGSSFDIEDFLFKGSLMTSNDCQSEDLESLATPLSLFFKQSIDHDFNHQSSRFLGSQLAPERFPTQARMLGDVTMDEFLEPLFSEKL